MSLPPFREYMTTLRLTKNYSSLHFLFQIVKFLCTEKLTQCKKARLAVTNLA